MRHIEDVRAELGDSELRSGYFEGKQGIYERAVNLALQAQHPDEAFDLAERGRSRTFLDLLGSQTTLSKGRTRALVDEEVRLRARLAEAQAQAQDAGEESDRARAQLEALDRDYRAFLVRVRKESLEQASLMAVEPVTLAEIQGLLPAGTTLLEYLVGDSGVVLWVVDRERATVVHLPGDRQALITQVRRFRVAITKQAPLADVQSQARALYRRLLEPARKEIRGDRVVIVPHGVLHYLPFVALRSSSTRWMVEDLAVSTLPSASVLRYLADKGMGVSARALVVGNPDLGAELALPWSEREARMVGQREKDATVLVRADATESQVKKLLPTAGVVHLATHGELSEDDPLSSAMLLVPGGGEDGRLEVREVFGLDMHARLVVLSACETGLGKLSRGDELVGLQRAFLYAGTPAVVTTLWKVDDKATFELVRSFYTRLEGAGPVEALRQAQVETMRAFPASLRVGGVRPQRSSPVTSPGLTRRALMRGALGSAGATLLLNACSGMGGKRAEAIDPRVPALIDRAISVDMHTHAAGAGYARAPRYDLAARMREGHMTAVCLCHSADGPVIGRTAPNGPFRQQRDPRPGELYAHTVRRLDFMDGLVASAHGLTRVLTPADLLAAKAAGQPALIGTIEGCQFMDGKLERIEEVYGRGIRQLQIVHYMPSDLGDQQTEPGQWKGLSPLGAEVIRECNRLGMVVDVAHGTYELVEQAAQVSAVPFILSHTSLSRGTAPAVHAPHLGGARPAHGAGGRSDRDLAERQPLRERPGLGGGHRPHRGCRRRGSRGHRHGHGRWSQRGLGRLRRPSGPGQSPSRARLQP